MGFKRKREGYQEQRPRLSPAESLVARLRPAIAQIGEPSRYAREGLMRSLMRDLGDVPESNFGSVLETLRAVVYEQPHKIGFLSFVIAGAPSHVSFLVLEMVHDEASRALAGGDYTRFKLFFRFLCALYPIIENQDVLLSCLTAMLSVEAEPALKIELYKTALLASLYLPPTAISAELRQKFVETELVDARDFEFFTGPNRPYETQYMGELLREAAKKLDANSWEVDILAANPLNPVEPASPKPASAEPEAKEPAEATGKEDDDYEPAGQLVESDVKRDSSEPAPDTEIQADAKPETDAAAEDESKDESKGEQEQSNGEAQTEAANTASTENGVSNEVEEAARESKPTAKHTLRSIHLPTPLPSPIEHLHSPAFFRCYLPLEDGVETVPSGDSICGLLLRDVAVDNIRHMDFNRREVTRQLIALDVFFSRNAFAPPGAWLDQVSEAAKEGKPTWKIEDIALEAIFSQMFDLANTAQLPLVYYHALLIEACVMAPQDIAPVLGRGLRFLFNSLESADAELLFRSVDWFAHHVSNFAFTWKWNEWKDSLSLPADHAQLVFIRELLAKEVRLSYPQRVRDILPEEFQALVPMPPDMPPFKYEGQEKGEALVNSLRAGDFGEAKQVLSAVEDKLDRTDLLVHTICHLGNRSVTHATTWIGKTEDLLTEFANKDEDDVATHAVNAIFEHWLQAPWVGALVVNQFIRAQLARPSVFVDYVVSHANLLLSSLGWETLVSNIAEANAALAGLKLEGEYAEWWVSRLQKSVSRLALQAEARAVKKAEAAEQAAEQAAAENEASANANANASAHEKSEPQDGTTKEGEANMQVEPEQVEPKQAEEPTAVDDTTLVEKTEDLDSHAEHNDENDGERAEEPAPKRQRMA